MARATLPQVQGTDQDHSELLLELCGGVAGVETARQAFVRLWNAYNFGVKSFQESVVPSYRMVGLRAETVSVFWWPWFRVVKGGRGDTVGECAN